MNVVYAMLCLQLNTIRNCSMALQKEKRVAVESEPARAPSPLIHHVQPQQYHISADHLERRNATRSASPMAGARLDTGHGQLTNNFSGLGLGHSAPDYDRAPSPSVNLKNSAIAYNPNPVLDYQKNATVIAAFAYQARSDKELSLERGDIVTVKKSERTWLLVNRVQRGWIPAAFVQSFEE